MSFQEQSQQSNMIEGEQCRDDPNVLHYYTSQRVDILNKLDSEKQKVQHAKEFMETQKNILKETIKFSHDIENENETTKVSLEKEIELRKELVKKLISVSEVINNNIENFNLLRSLMQLCLNDQHESDELKQNLLDDFEKIKSKMNTKEKGYVQKLVEMSENLEIKQQHSSIVEYFETMKNKNQEITNKKKNIFDIQNQMGHNKQCNDELNKNNISLKEEQYNMSNKFSELQIMNKEFTEQKDNEDSENNKKISDLNKTSTNLNNEILKLKNEVKNIQKGFDSRTEFLDEWKNKKISAEESLSNLNTKCVQMEKEIHDSKEQLLKELEDYDSQLSILNKEIEELEKNTLFEEENEVFEKEYFEVNTEETNFNNEINDIEIYLMQLQNEVKQEQELLEEQFDKFESENIALKESLENENQEEISNDKDQQEVKVKLKELFEDYEVVNLQNDAISAEAELDEITINSNIDLLKNEISQFKGKNQEKQTEIKKYVAAEKEKNRQLEINFDEKNVKLSSAFKEIKNKLNERNQNEQKTIFDELKKLQGTNINLELHMSELKVSTQNLQNELELKIKELAKIHENQSKKSFIEAELDKNIDTSSPIEAHSFKKAKYDFKIPKNKIPPSKYSSTSDTSSDEVALVKKRKISFKQRRATEKKSIPARKSGVQTSQKSIDDIFEALKSGSESRPTRNRSNKKTVF